ncbi:MAG: metallophosphoesterase family protein [Burkholderiales bacterium]
MSTPGRSCPLHYRYNAQDIGQGDPIDADVLYVVGGLYGNPYALDSVLELASRELGQVRIVFNGDFHWFDVDAALFADIDRRVMQHAATRGNVETELALPAGDAGCGCGYPDWVSDGEVARSNEIMNTLLRVASEFPQAMARYANLPMHLGARVGDLRIAIVHGDAQSLAGWAFSQENLLASPEDVAQMLGQVAADVIACTHTCLPVAQRFETSSGQRCLINNGAAGMPNFAGDLRGLVTRIAPSASPLALYGAGVQGMRVEALPVDCGGKRWLSHFDELWPAGSPASVSYRQRIAAGPSYRVAQATREGFNSVRPSQMVGKAGGK